METKTPRYRVKFYFHQPAEFAVFEEALKHARDIQKSGGDCGVIHAMGEEGRDPSDQGRPFNEHIGVCYGANTYGCIQDALVNRRTEDGSDVLVSGYANKTLKELVEEAEAAGDDTLLPVLVTYDAAAVFDRERYCKPPVEIDEARWWDMLEVLPPIQWTNRGSAESFFMSERLTGELRACFVKIGKRYFEFTTEKIPHEEAVRIVMLSQAWLSQALLVKDTDSSEV
jgi:hypothetical protein